MTRWFTLITIICACLYRKLAQNNSGRYLRWYKAGTLAAELGCTQEAINEACPDAVALIADLERWWKLFAGFAVAKRIQAPPVLSLTKRAFGYDHREAQLTPYFSREYYELKEDLLK